MTEKQSNRADLANEIFERLIRPQVDMEEEAHKYVAIDVESEDFEVDANQLAAADRLIERRPEAEGRIWFRRVGSRFAHHFGGWPREEDAK